MREGSPEHLTQLAFPSDEATHCHCDACWQALEVLMGPRLELLALATLSFHLPPRSRDAGFALDHACGGLLSPASVAPLPIRHQLARNPRLALGHLSLASVAPLPIRFQLARNPRLALSGHTSGAYAPVGMWAIITDDAAAAAATAARESRNLLRRKLLVDDQLTCGAKEEAARDRLDFDDGEQLLLLDFLAVALHERALHAHHLAREPVAVRALHELARGREVQRLDTALLVAQQLRVALAPVQDDLKCRPLPSAG